MIESFFKSLKNNYLYKKKKLRTTEDAHRHIRYYVNSHNKTPLKLFKGATPNETYNNNWPADDLKSINKNKEFALIKRKNNKSIKKCRACYL